MLDFGKALKVRTKEPSPFLKVFGPLEVYSVAFHALPFDQKLVAARKFD
jgi:hypothetical protein